MCIASKHLHNQKKNLQEKSLLEIKNSFDVEYLCHHYHKWYQPALSYKNNDSNIFHNVLVEPGGGCKVLLKTLPGRDIFLEKVLIFVTDNRIG